jgi:hypothetical protein
VDWSHLPHDRDQLRGNMNRVMKFPVPGKWEFLDRPNDNQLFKNDSAPFS